MIQKKNILRFEKNEKNAKHVYGCWFELLGSILARSAGRGSINS
jgi:hypothetical protein